MNLLPFLSSGLTWGNGIIVRFSFNFMLNFFFLDFIFLLLDAVLSLDFSFWVATSLPYLYCGPESSLICMNNFTL